MSRITQQELEGYLWGAAVLLRGLIDAGDYKQFIFPLLFYKRVADVWDEEYQAAVSDKGGDLSYANFSENHRFQIPDGAHWNDVRQTPKNVGSAIQRAMRAIESANPEMLDGIFGDVAAALEFDDQSVKQVVSNIQELKDKLPEAMQKCLAFFTGVDRSQTGYEGLIAAQQCLPNNTVRDNFAAEYSVLGKIWEALSPDSVLGPFEKDYKWLSQVYQSVQPSSGHGKLIWHSLGAKTIELIHQNVHVDAVRDDLDTLVLDADLLEAVLSNPDHKSAKEIEIKLVRRMRKHAGKPKFRKLSERLDALKDRFESGQLNSVEFLKQLLEIAKETLQAEKDVPPEEDEDRGKAALTELFNEVKTSETPIMVERVVTDIDEIVRLVRFPGWQGTQAGEREVKKALRKALFKYKLHADEELFEKAFSYIRQYY